MSGCQGIFPQLPFEPETRSHEDIQAQREKKMYILVFSEVVTGMLTCALFFCYINMCKLTYLFKDTPYSTQIYTTVKLTSELKGNCLKMSFSIFLCISSGVLRNKIHQNMSLYKIQYSLQMSTGPTKFGGKRPYTFRLHYPKMVALNSPNVINR